MEGSFTGAGVSEVAVSIEGCESHADNRGGLLLIRAEPGGRRVADYYSGVHPDSCKAHRDTASGCLAGGEPPEWLTRGEVTALSSRDVNGDGEKDAVVEVSYARARPGPSFVQYCRDLVEQLGSEEAVVPPRPALLGRPTKYTLTFVYDGPRFKPTRTTEALRSRL